MNEYIYRGPNITYVDGPHKGKSFVNGKRYTEFPEEIAGRMHKEVVEDSGSRAVGDISLESLNPGTLDPVQQDDEDNIDIDL